MDLVFNLLEKYPSKHEEVQEKQPTQEVKEVPTTHEEVQEVLDNADTGSSLPEMARNLIIDIGVPAAAGVAGGAIASKIASRKPAQAAASKALELLKRGADDALGHQTSLIKKGTSKVMKMMAQNEAAAKSVAEGGNGKKALRTILKNTKREAELGPRFMDDIQMILEKDTGLSEKEVNKAIKDFMKENANNVELIKLIEAKEPIATYSHSLGAQDLAYRLAKKAGLDDEKAKKIADAALVHDIGKIQVPDSVISSKARFGKDKYPNLKKWMLDHDVVGGEILKSDPYKAKIARNHHRSPELYGGDEDVGLVTVADVYEALTSNKRSYKPGHSIYEAFDILSDDVKNGNIKEEYFDLVKALHKDGLLPYSYNYKSPLESPYKSMKANEIKKQVASDYATKFFMDKAKKSIPLGTAAGLGASAVMELVGNPYANIPSLSDILSLYSPTMKPKAEKLEDIKRWYNDGHYNDEIENLIVNTDFKNNKQVTKLWKLMRDQIKD